MPKGKSDTWVIGVCRTCGRLAQFPFCEHRDQPPGGHGGWYENVLVRGTWHPFDAPADRP